LDEGQNQFIFYVEMLIIHQQPQSKLWKRKTHPWWWDNYCFIKPKILNQIWHCHARVLKVLPIMSLYSNGSLHPTLLVFMLLVLLFFIASFRWRWSFLLVVKKSTLKGTRFSHIETKNLTCMYTWCIRMGAIASTF
jgi:hypothetical protein